MRTPAVVSCLVLVTSSLVAQARPRLSFDATGAYVRLQDRAGVSRDVLTGAVLAGEARVSLDRWVLGAGYLDGKLKPDSGSSRDLVEGRVYVGAAPWPWLTVTAGPLIRAYVTDTATERWVLWQARARVHGPLFGTTLATYGELWRAVSANVNLPDPVDRVQGGEVGLVLRPSRGPLWVRLAYRIDEASLGDALRRETVEAISIAVGTGTRD